MGRVRVTVEEVVAGVLVRTRRRAVLATDVNMVSGRKVNKDMCGFGVRGQLSVRGSLEQWRKAEGS